MQLLRPILRALTLAAVLAGAAVAQTTGEPSRPPATVGRAMALSVAVNPDEGSQTGVLFPLTVKAGNGSGEQSSSAELDGMMTQTVHDATTWIQAQRGRPGFRVPEGFPSATDLFLQFLPEAHYVEGDSAGVALACAIYSAISDTPLLNQVGMTGAIDSQGNVHAVAHIRTKLDGVLDNGLTSMILPAENWWRTEDEAKRLWRDAVPDIEVVFVRDLDEAFFFAFGPYGPQGQAYARYSAELKRGLELFNAGDYERARANFTWLAAWQPGDSTALVWIGEAGAKYVASVYDAALAAAAEHRTEIAQLLAQRVADMGGQQWADRARALASDVAAGTAAGSPDKPQVPGPVPMTDWTVQAPLTDRLPASLSDRRWDVARPVSFDVDGLGNVTLAALHSWDRALIAVSYADASGAVEDDGGRWHLTEDGFTERSREDRAALAIGDEHTVADAAVRALDLATTAGVDEWVFGAGPLRAAGHAADLSTLSGQATLDSGTPPLMRNEAPSGGPAGSFDGILGIASNPNVLRASDAGYLTGDPLRGAQVFRDSCQTCHAQDAEGTAGHVAVGAALYPWGSQGLLSHHLATDADHVRIFGGAPPGDVIAYVRVTQPPPSSLVVDPSGSAADVKLETRWVAGRWWLVFSRALDTGNADDLSLAGADESWVALAARDGASGAAAAGPAVKIHWL